MLGGWAGSAGRDQEILFLSQHRLFMARVVLENLVKDYTGAKSKTVRAVNEINLEIVDREFMVLVGPSGCGKSTSLRMIAGLEEVTSGAIYINDRVVNDVLPKDRDIAMVFQNYALYPHMSVYDNMAFGLKLMKLGKVEIQRRVGEAAQILNIEELMDRKPKALSGGQQQRVAVGRAIVRKPKVFLFDEPLSNLDAKMRGSMRKELSKLHQRLDSTMIYVTHDQVEAMTMGDRITVMDEGKIMQTADPLTLYNHPVNMFVAGFIGSPPMNFLPGILEQEGEYLYFSENNAAGSPVRIRLTDELARAATSYSIKEVVFGIRPEDIKETINGDANDRHSPVKAKLEVAETMGAETHLHLHTGEHAFIARINVGRHYKINDTVAVEFNVGRGHLFDPASGEVINKVS